jgi:hypothetical protein
VITLIALGLALVLVVAVLVVAVCAVRACRLIARILVLCHRLHIQVGNLIAGLPIRRQSGPQPPDWGDDNRKTQDVGQGYFTEWGWKPRG